MLEEWGNPEERSLSYQGKHFQHDQNQSLYCKAHFPGCVHYLTWTPKHSFKKEISFQIIWLQQYIFKRRVLGSRWKKLWAETVIEQTLCKKAWVISVCRQNIDSVLLEEETHWLTPKEPGSLASWVFWVWYKCQNIPMGTNKAFTDKEKWAGTMRLGLLMCFKWQTSSITFLSFIFSKADKLHFYRY